jgi:hypothetical protein
MEAVPDGRPATGNPVLSGAANPLVLKSVIFAGAPVKLNLNFNY